MKTGAHTQKGAGAVTALLVIGLLILGGFGYYYISQQGTEEEMHSDESMQEGDAVMDSGQGATGEEAMMDGDAMEGEVMMNGDVMMEVSFSGSVLAGSDDRALLLDFNKADYEKAVASGKLVVLFFYANWCPVCKEEFPRMQSAFNSLKSDQVVGFRVNYNDNQTDEDEKALAREFGVGYQHTKVFVKNGERILKAPESWSEAQFISTINENL